MGVEKTLLRAGTGPKANCGQNVTVHCTGFGKNGDLNQNTKDPGQQPFTFKIGHGSVIKGWDEGVMGVQVGEVARLQIPSTGDNIGVSLPRTHLKMNTADKTTATSEKHK